MRNIAIIVVIAALLLSICGCGRTDNRAADGKVFVAVPIKTHE